MDIRPLTGELVTSTDPQTRVPKDVPVSFEILMVTLYATLHMGHMKYFFLSKNTFWHVKYCIAHHTRLRNSPNSVSGFQIRMPAVVPKLSITDVEQVQFVSRRTWICRRLPFAENNHHAISGVWCITQTHFSADLAAH